VSVGDATSTNGVRNQRVDVVVVFGLGRQSEVDGHEDEDVVVDKGQEVQRAERL
jgi:hypothetical protein